MSDSPVIRGARACALAPLALALAAVRPAAAQEALALPPVVIDLSPFARTEAEIAQPVSVLRGEALRLREGTNLGATLDREPGVQSSAYGAGAGRPIIRGFDSTRVRITESGMGVGDVSGASPDHRVAADTFNSDQVEVLRGPATLLYGSGAIGGVANVVSNRIPRSRPSEWGAELQARAGSALHEAAGAFAFDGPVGERFAARLEGFRQRTGDYELAKPVYDRNGDLIGDQRLPNSATLSDSVSAGLSGFGQAGWVGGALQSYRSDYGIPNPEEPVNIRLRRTRGELRAESTPTSSGAIEGLRAKLAWTSYEHREVADDGEVGARFDNHALEARLELAHRLGDWRGVLGTQWVAARTQGSGEGELPLTRSDSIAVFLVEELRLGDWSLELGGRGESSRYDPEAIASGSRSYPLFSAATALRYRFARDWDVGVNVSASQRAPAIEELYFVGAHPATAAYEIGNPDLVRESSLNLEASLRKTTGTWRGQITAFQNRSRNYIYGYFDGSSTDLIDPDTGLVEEQLANLLYRQDGAKFTGLEAELRVGSETGAHARLWGDLVRARLTSGPFAGDNLPRISPARLGLDLSQRLGDWSGKLGVMHVLRQNRTAAFDVRNGEAETATPGYTLVDAVLSWRTEALARGAVAYVRVSNLTNAQAFAATSFLKDVAPLPARSFWVGLRASF